MITAIETNILLDVLIPNETFADASLAAVEEASNQGALVICDMVYAELCIHFASQRECDHFVEENEILVEPLSRAALFHAGRIWREYRTKGGKRARILTDFFVASHAQVQADCLLSRDRGFYRDLFPALKVMDPSAR
jgi:predicted nucleic acid-binding protein